MDITPIGFDKWSLINKWRSKFNLSMSQFINLLESYRRVMEYHNGNVDQKLLLLNYPSKVKTSKIYLHEVYTEQKRCLCWYSLTEAGKQAVRELINIIEFDEKLNLFIYKLE